MARVFCKFVVFCWLIAGVSIYARGEDEYRNWTIKTKGDNQSFRGKLVGLKQGSITLADPKGKERVVPLASFSERERKAALIEIVGSGVVMVKVEDTLGEPLGIGSGFLFRNDGMILTNYHVVRGAAKVRVEFRDSPGDMDVDCLAVDRLNDVAVLKVSKKPEGAHVIELAVRTMPQQGDTVWTIGHPKGLKDTVSWGELNAVRKTTKLPEAFQKQSRAPKNTTWLQTGAVISFGSSGGPMLNELGQAIGMNTFIAGPQLGFALYLEHAKPAFTEARTASALELPMAPTDDEPGLAWLSTPIAPIVKKWVAEASRLKADTTRSADQAEERLAPLRAELRPKLHKIAQNEPAKWPAYQAMLLLVDTFADATPASQKATDQAVTLLLKHHAGKKDMGGVAIALAASGNPRAEEVCQRVLKESDDVGVKALARLGLIQSRLTWLARDGGMELTRTNDTRRSIRQGIDQFEKEMAKESAGDKTVKEFAMSLRDQLSTIKVGLPAQEISGIDTDGKTFKLSEYKGKVVLVDFFADWCPWCRKMYSFEQKLVKELADKSFSLLGVNTDNQQVLTGLVTKGTVTWRTWADGQNGPIAQKWHIDSYPSLYLVDQNGIVRRHFTGAPEDSELKAAIETLLNEANVSKQATLDR